MQFIGFFLCLVCALFCSQVSAYQVQGKDIQDDQGKTITLQGVNWFGFETQNHILHGLWTRNWQSMLTQMQQLGFNAVRIPVCPDTLHGAAVSSVDYAKNPDLAGLNALAALDLIVQGFNNAGMYILLDHHRPDCNAISELWYTTSYSEQNWIDDLVFLADRYRNVARFIGIDIKNEPHGGVSWGVSNIATDWNKAAERAANAILATNNKLLIFVEGIQENSACSSFTNHWWGGNLEPCSCSPLSIPADRLVLSPHVYGPDVYNQPYFTTPDFPGNMPAIWDQHFGFLMDQGHAVVIGEFGGRYGHGGYASDKTWQDALVDYLLNKKIKNAFYWCWNPNSGDTGGILQDDWQTVWTDKVALLQRLWGGTTTQFACNDGIDNDGDGLIDYPKDPGCSSATDNDETDPPPPPPPGQLTTKVEITSDWQAGYCANVIVSNPNNVAIAWKVSFTVEGKVNNLWNATWSQSGNTVTAEGLSWNSPVAANGSVTFGFCADRTITTPTADLVLTKSVAPNPVTQGNNLTYTLTVTNNGPNNASNTSIVDTLPTGVGLVSADAGCSNANGTVTCTIGALANGATISKTLVVKTLSAGNISNTAKASATETDPNPANNSATAIATVNFPNYDLSLVKAASANPITIGGNLVYTLTVMNLGPVGVTNVKIVDPLPAGVSFVSAASGCTNVSGTVTCNIANLAGLATASRTVTVKPTIAGTLANTATVSATEVDPNKANNTATTTITVNSLQADLSLSKTASANPVVVGTNLVYTLTAKNLGPQNATNVKIVDPLPAGTSLVSVGTGCTNASGTVTCTIASLANGATASATITVKPGSAGTLSNTATISASETDPNKANNTSTATTAVSALRADIVITKTGSATGTKGINLSYTLSVKNLGPQNATGVVAVDTLPVGVTFVSASTGCTNASGVVTCKIGNVNSGATAANLTVTVKPTVAPATLVNTAKVSATETDPNTGNNTSSVTTTIK